MKTKRVSALAVFKKEKADSLNEAPSSTVDKTAVKRSLSDVSASLGSISKKKNGKFLRALRNGTLKNKHSDSVRKSRPSFLPDSMLDSPYLTAITQKKDSPHLSIVKAKKQKSPVPQKEKETKKKVKKEEKNKANEEEEKEENHQPYMFDSNVEAKKMFEHVIHPVTINNFFSQMWERKPLVVRRHIPTYNEGWFSTEELDQILRKENVMFGVNLDVTTYTNGKRETHNPPGRAHAAVVWDYYQNGCSIRLLNPQTYSQNVWKRLSLLQDYFGCMAGANIYLTPPGSQGFAPHYDDIEAFVIQLEGKKKWTLYPSRKDSEVLAYTSSENFSPEDLGNPLINVELKAGDMLYFPSGMIHQAHTDEDCHSLHITVSCCQKNTWGDFLQKLLPTAIKIAMEEDIEFRKSLPRDYLSYMGVVHSETHSEGRQNFISHVDKLMRRLIAHVPVDAACDQMGKKFMHDTLPPVITKEEKSRSIGEQGEHWCPLRQTVISRVELEPDTKLKLIRAGVIRLVMEDDQVRLYHNLENSRLYHKVDPTYLEIPAQFAPAVEYLIHNYPQYVSLESLPLNSMEEQVELAQALYEKGMLITESQLETLDEDDDNLPE